VSVKTRVAAIAGQVDCVSCAGVGRYLKAYLRGQAGLFHNHDFIPCKMCGGAGSHSPRLTIHEVRAWARTRGFEYVVTSAGYMPVEYWTPYSNIDWAGEYYPDRYDPWTGDKIVDLTPEGEVAGVWHFITWREL
jgi:hypothetical protein